MQEEDRVGKRCLPHQRRHIVAVNPDCGRLGPYDGGSPFIHEARIITAFGAPRHVCNGTDTVTFLLPRRTGATVPVSREVHPSRSGCLRAHRAVFPASLEAEVGKARAISSIGI